MKCEVYKREDCRLCGSRRLELVVELTPTPPGNHFVPKDKVGAPQKAYPLELYFCNDCHHVQLGHVVAPEILYQQNYSYVSGTSPVFLKHLKEYAAYITKQFAIPQGGLVVDIGSNDGSALKFFQQDGYRVVGVDPAREIVQLANASGIETVCDFFNHDVGRKLAQQYGPAALITSLNACAHIDDLRSVFEGARDWLAEDGLFVVEVGYLLDIVNNVWFDTIYHEHVDFHSLEPLLHFFKATGFDVIAAQRISPQGGSIRIIAQKKGGPRQADGTVLELISLERVAGLDRADTFKAFGRRVDAIGRELAHLVRGLKAEGKSIAGYGAPTKATTLLSHFRLQDVLDFLVDDNPLKQNLFSPGHHIPVYSSGEMYRRKPDYLLILAWNFAENIMQKHRAFKENGGRFILPMPAPKIVE